jgi:ATP-binding cassette, subfamily B, bacterial
MSSNQHPSRGLFTELRLMGKRARQAWRLVPRRHKVALGVAALVMALTSVCSTSLPILIGRLIDRIIDGTHQGLGNDALYRITAWFLLWIGGAYLLREGLNVLRRYLVENTCTRLNRDMNVKLVAHLMKVNLARISQEKVGALHGRIFRSVDGLVRFVRVSFLDFLPALVTGAFALTTAVYKQPLVGVIMVGVIPVAVFLTVRQLSSQKGVRLRLMRATEGIDGAVVEQLGGIEYVRAANTQQLEVKRMARACEKRRAREIRHHFQMSLFGCAKALNEGFFHVLVLGSALFLAINHWHGIGLGDVFMFSGLFLGVMAPLSEVHRILDEGHEASLRVGDLLEMMSEPADPSFHTEPGQAPVVVPGRPIIEVDDLHVEYTTPQGKTVQALDGISLSIRHGETVGVAGRSGCGKSTWLKVLLRLTHPCGGRVRIGGVPLEQVTREDIGQLLGYVGQNPFVFSGTVAENIAYGAGGATPEQIRRAAEMAHLHDEIMEMPGGYEAEIRERGSNLSGGQRQRLAIARILLKHPQVLILDEATSALDNISERYVQRALGVVDPDRTTILVAHRLSTLRDADRIFVFDDGRVVEVGRYVELVRRGGVFAELVRSAELGLTDGDAAERLEVARAAS